MITISLCMIVKNEEKILARCLDSIADLVDEIIIVDTGSTDDTKKIAAGYTDRLYDFTWIGDFAAARNFAFSKAEMEYIYSADADEVLDGQNREAFRRLKETFRCITRTSFLLGQSTILTGNCGPNFLKDCGRSGGRAPFMSR